MTAAVNAGEADAHIDKRDSVIGTVLIAGRRYTGGASLFHRLKLRIPTQPAALLIFNSLEPHSVEPVMSGERKSIAFFNHQHSLNTWCNVPDQLDRSKVRAISLNAADSCDVELMLRKIQ